MAESINTENKMWLSPTDLEVEFGFSKSTQAKLRMKSNRNGLSIPFSKTGKYIRYSRARIYEWLEAHQVQ